jgi:hypothetical protein
VPAYWIATQPSWPLSREREAAYQLACEELAAQVDPNDVVLAPDIGVVGWCLEGTEILDPIGLVSPNALPYFEPRPQGPAIPLDLVQDMQPEYIVALEQYLKPTLSVSEDFVQAYRVVWSTPVSIAGQAQPLQIFRRFIIR